MIAAAMAIEVRYYTDEDGWSVWVAAEASGEATAVAGLLISPGDLVTVHHADDHPTTGLAGVTAEYRLRAAVGTHAPVSNE